MNRFKYSMLFDTKAIECYSVAWMCGRFYAGRPWTLSALGEWIFVVISCDIVNALFLTLEDQQENDIL